MDLRPLAVLVMYVFAGVYALRGGPFAALLVYMWLGYFRPDHWAGWSIFVRSIPMSYWTGTLLVATTLLSPNVRLVPRGWMWVILGFVAHLGISLWMTPVDLSQWPWSVYGYRSFVQSILVAFIMTALVTDRHRFRLLVIVMALALSLEAAKQGWVMLLFNSSETNQNDIPFLGDNNHVAVGVLMMAAVLGALASVAKRRPEKWLFGLLMVGMLFRALTTHSRGGFLALGALAIAGLMHARRRIMYLGLGAFVGVVLLSALPTDFWVRMETITPNARIALETTPADEEAETSAQSRVHFWRVALRIAAARPILGFGYLLYPAVYDQFDDTGGVYGMRRAVHSAWFGALAETGFVGFAWFVTILAGAMVACFRVQRLARAHPELHELGRYAAGLNAAFITYIVGATFVSLTYLDLLWHMLTLAFILSRIARAEAAELAVARVSPVVVAQQLLPRVARPVAQPALAARASFKTLS
jgi:probable O-glycosylation ligase (exosortase A-associated)